MGVWVKSAGKAQCTVTHPTNTLPPPKENQESDAKFCEETRITTENENEKCCQIVHQIAKGYKFGEKFKGGKGEEEFF